ncbi:hypothetical protein AB0I61_32905 [Polymorphospora rubra]|uniref:hypothetical protein n=1 Tax=Polymorphospora rubra TaxID=338584 RepID=UPI003401D536
MSDHDRTEHTLTLLARRGTYEVLRVMHEGGGFAAFAQISAGSPESIALLRALAAEGFVTGLHGGTLDDAPSGDTGFRLTSKGEAIFRRLLRLHQWTTTRTVGFATSVDPSRT